MSPISGVYSGSTPVDSGGPAFKIVEVLRQYSAPLPVEFVAKLAGIYSQDAAALLAGLQAQGIVTIDAGNNVALAESDRSASPFFRWLTK